mgnify:CR=1 FL=1
MSTRKGGLGRGLDALIPQSVIPTEIKNVISIRLASIEIPNAWYFISQSKKNNTFTI